MKDFLALYTELIEGNHEEIGKVSLKTKIDHLKVNTRCCIMYIILF